DEKVAFAGVLEVVSHVEVGIHPGFKDWDPTEFVEFGGMGRIVEGAGDEYVEAAVSRFASGSDEVRSGDGAEFWTDEYGRALFGAVRVALGVMAFGADVVPGP